MPTRGRCSEDPDVKGTETLKEQIETSKHPGCSEDPDVKGTETLLGLSRMLSLLQVAARIPM